MNETFTCFDCGKEKPVQHSGGTGYELDHAMRKVCYDCCAIRDKEHMETSDKIALYLVETSAGHYEVVNWPSTLRFKVTGYTFGRHNIAGSRVDVWFKDHVGQEWHGVQYGSNTQVVHCRKLKQRTA